MLQFFEVFDFSDLLLVDNLRLVASLCNFGDISDIFLFEFKKESNVITLSVTSTFLHGLLETVFLD